MMKGNTMISYLRKEKWSPYLVGALIGTLLTVILVIGYQIGVSSGVGRMGLLLEEAIAPDHSGTTPYLQKLLADHVIFDWKVLFVLGLFFGSMISSKLSAAKTCQKNTIWKGAFGPSKLKRYVTAFIGGILLLFGARIADGCTSGHAISGGAQLSIVSWAFMMAVFALAIPTSLILYRKK